MVKNFWSWPWRKQTLVPMRDVMPLLVILQKAAFRSKHCNWMLCRPITPSWQKAKRIFSPFNNLSPKALLGSRFRNHQVPALFDTLGDIKLIDYGISCEVDHVLAKRHTSVGTPYWMAPEVILCDENQCHEYDARWRFTLTWTNWNGGGIAQT